MCALTAALAGATRPVDRHLDGIDISPFLLGHRETSGRDTFFHYAWTYLQVVRQGGWKLVIPRPANPLWTSWYGREGQIWMYYKGRSRAHGPAGTTTTRMGVVIAGQPTGQFVKHKANPLHNGHEVLVWPQSYGIGSMATAAGPRQLNYAFDGLQFTARNPLTNPPQAPGIFREDNFRNNLIAPVPQWGIAHARAGDDLHLVRFDFLYGQQPATPSTN